MKITKKSISNEPLKIEITIKQDDQSEIKQPTEDLEEKLDQYEKMLQLNLMELKTFDSDRVQRRADFVFSPEISYLQLQVNFGFTSDITTISIPVDRKKLSMKYLMEKIHDDFPYFYFKPWMPYLRELIKDVVAG